jgi:hypothetical protein
MPTHIGQVVLIDKANPSLDETLLLGQNVPMANQRKKPLSKYELGFLARTWAARESKDLSQDKFGEQLGGFSQDHYKQYEIRGMLPHELIPKFLELTGVSYDYLFTGRAAGPAWRERYQVLLERQEKSKKVKKAA